MSKYFTKIRSKPKYQDLKKDLHSVLSRIPLVGKKLEEVIEQVFSLEAGATGD